MRLTNWTKMVLLAFALGGMLPAMTGCKTSEPAGTSSQAVKYTCPMHPEIVRNVPGNCPLCGMPLVVKH